MESSSNCHHTPATGILDPYSDADAFMEWNSDERVGTFCSWDTFTSKEAAIDHAINPVTLHPWHEDICLSDLSVGSISMTPFPSYDGCQAEIGVRGGFCFLGKRDRHSSGENGRERGGRGMGASGAAGGGGGRGKSGVTAGFGEGRVYEGSVLRKYCRLKAKSFAR